MKLGFVEIRNFRRLLSTHIDFDDETTIFVGSNNSGKTSAMVALRYFLIDNGKLSSQDITLSNWPKLDALGEQWENAEPGFEPALKDLVDLLPTMDLWLKVNDSELHHVIHLLPTLDWSGGLLGVRLRYEPKDLGKLFQEFKGHRQAARDMAVAAAKRPDAKEDLVLWPMSMVHFLERRFRHQFTVHAYVLDPDKVAPPDNGLAKPQELPESSVALEGDPLSSLIRINEIPAQRELADAGNVGGQEGSEEQQGKLPIRPRRKLSEQLRSYYNRHLSPDKTPDESDLDALTAIQNAERTFDERLETGFKDAIDELQDLGYPGLADPRLRIKTQLNATDGLKHRSAVQYELAASPGNAFSSLMLPEDYSGLGYQNLVSMVFLLMSFRDDWMRVGKAGLGADTDEGLQRIPPLHLVLVEEPEAHLHAQVQQVFIKKAYDLLRNHEHLGKAKTLSTQLVVSTHSSHLAHEANFQCLRYFRRRPRVSASETPSTTVANLSDVFGTEDKTQRFVARYLKATHCDLFFADAVILVEGQAERILVPFFIRHHYRRLARRYVSLLEIGGSHAHRFRSLIEKLGLTTLIIADLDSVGEVREGDKTRWRSARPELGAGQKSNNPVLKKWHPAQDGVDELVVLSSEDRTLTQDSDFSVHVSYQQGILPEGAGGEQQSVIPRTFEDAFVLSNRQVLKGLEGASVTNKISSLINDYDGEELADELFALLKNAEKAAFALDVFMHDKPKEIAAPNYIAEGLSWLDEELEHRGTETFQVTASDPEGDESD